MSKHVGGRRRQNIHLRRVSTPPLPMGGLRFWDYSFVSVEAFIGKRLGTVITQFLMLLPRQKKDCAVKCKVFLRHCARRVSCKPKICTTRKSALCDYIWNCSESPANEEEHNSGRWLCCAHKSNDQEARFKSYDFREAGLFQ